jgi:hypothetical protein
MCGLLGVDRVIVNHVDRTVVSHRSDRTPETPATCAVVGVKGVQVRAGSPSRLRRRKKDERLPGAVDDAGEPVRFTETSVLLAKPMSAGSDAVCEGLTSIHSGYILRD